MKHKFRCYAHGCNELADYWIQDNLRFYNQAACRKHAIIRALKHSYIVIRLIDYPIEPIKDKEWYEKGDRP